MTAPAIRTVIVDDEPAARGALRSLLAGEPDIEVIAELGDGASALEVIRTESPDLLFLDIQMPEMDGFTLLRRLQSSSLPVTVFVTAYDQYALRAFDAEAIDYLLKPFSDERFHQSLARARQQIQLGRVGELSQELRRLLARTERAAEKPGFVSRLTVKTDGRITVVPVSDIDWLEAEGDFVKVRCGRTSHLMRETMKDVESMIDPGRFVRIHRSTIVNVDRIKEMQPYFKDDYVIILQDGSRLRLSRRYKTRLEAALGSRF
jgi:two-component system, LytTR family, response regulator